MLGQSECVFKDSDPRCQIPLQKCCAGSVGEVFLCALSQRFPGGSFPASDISEKLLPPVKLLPVGGIIIQCLYPQLLVSKSKPFQIQYCIFIKVNLLFSSPTALSDLICRGHPTSGGGGGGGVGRGRPRRQGLQKRSSRAPLGLREVERPETQCPALQGGPVSSCL